jgi:hypothetical protein
MFIVAAFTPRLAAQAEEGASRREEARMSGNHNALQIRLSCPLFPHGKHMDAFKLPLAFYPEHSSIQEAARNH